MSMGDDEIREVLVRALALRPPRFETNGGPPVGASAKVAALEDYLLDSAVLGAELEEALHWCDVLTNQFAKQIENMTGYEVALPRKSRDRITQADIAAAKRVVDPVAFEIGADMKRLHVSLVRQIDRLRHEHQWVVSRAYTFITGS
jgi:hypothetical protein